MPETKTIKRTATQRRRLKKLADALRTIPKKQFDILPFCNGDPKELGCGSVACAIGHCPIIFPEDWTYYNCGYRKFFPRLKGSRSRWPFGDAANFFGLKSDELDDLFTYSGYYNGQHATPVQVARKIEKLLASKT